MALNTQNFLQSKASNQEKQCKIQQQNEITTHAYNRKKKKGNATNRAKTIIILIFTSKQNKHNQVAQFARQKEQRKP
jgi:hypothetical protein